MSHVTRRVAYIAVHGFWPVEKLAEMTDGSIGCGGVARGGYLFA